LHSEWNDAGAHVTFIYAAPASTSAAPTLVGGLQTGNPPPGGDPTRPTLTGHVASGGSLAGIIVELDYDGDDVTDQTTTTDANGNFSVQPQTLDFSSAASVKVKVSQVDPTTHHVITLGWPENPEEVSYVANSTTEVSDAAQTRNDAVNNA